MAQYQDAKRHDIMLFALHWSSVAKAFWLCEPRGEQGGTNGWRGMQPCIGSAGSEGLPPLPSHSSLVHVQAASVTHLPAETWEGNISKLSKWRLPGQSGDGTHGRAKKEGRRVQLPTCHY